MSPSSKSVIVSWHINGRLKSESFDTLIFAFEFAKGLQSNSDISDIRVCEISLYKFSKEVESK